MTLIKNYADVNKNAISNFFKSKFTPILFEIAKTS